METVLDQNPVPNQFYYTLSHNDKSDNLSDKTALSFKSSQCPSGQILKIRCKNLECGIRTQVASTARCVRLHKRLRAKFEINSIALDSKLKIFTIDLRSTVSVICEFTIDIAYKF